jgi:hypothetical protein
MDGPASPDCASQQAMAVETAASILQFASLRSAFAKRHPSGGRS